MLGLPVKVRGLLGFVATIAAYTSLEVIVLALATNPATVREIKVILVHTGIKVIGRNSSFLFGSLIFIALLSCFPFFSLLFFFLIFTPFGGSRMETFFSRSCTWILLGVVFVSGGSSWALRRACVAAQAFLARLTVFNSKSRLLPGHEARWRGV